MEAYVSKFEEGSASFQTLLGSISSALEKERETLEKQRQELQQERTLFEQECSRVQQVFHDAEQVTLNIGGHKFTTTVGTLRNAAAPSLFSAMFSGRHQLKLDKDGCYFIDRDGRHFHQILNHLRDGQFNYPANSTDFRYLLELRAEAEYYGLTALVSQIDRYPYNMLKVVRATQINDSDNWMYEDSPDEVVFTVDKPCQLLGAGMCGTEGGMTVDLEVTEVDPEDYSQVVGKLQRASKSFIKADGQVVQLMLPAPVLLQPGKTYCCSAAISGSEGCCCEDCLEVVLAGGIKVEFMGHESNNGTNEQRGQFPELYLRAMGGYDAAVWQAPAAAPAAAAAESPSQVDVDLVR